MSHAVHRLAIISHRIQSPVVITKWPLGSQSLPASSTKKVEIFRGVSEIPLEVQGVQGILLDQFGVLHNGKRAYVGAIQAVSHLADAGIKLLILSNSSRRSDAIIPKLGRLGFREADFAGAITSGEIAHRSLEHREGRFWTQLGKRCIHFTWGERGQVSLAGLGLEVVTAVEDAEFILASGTECLGHGDEAPPEPVTMDAVHSLLRDAARRGGIPMLVANPDVVTVSGGGLVPMPGTFAKWYSEAGGEVHMLGKPAPGIYKVAMEMLGLQAEEVLAVGDSVEHDIKGANASGVDSLFVAGGIDSEQFRLSPESPDLDLEILHTWLSKQEHAPTYAIPYLQC